MDTTTGFPMRGRTMDDLKSAEKAGIAIERRKTKIYNRKREFLCKGGLSILPLVGGRDESLGAPADVPPHK